MRFESSYQFRKIEEDMRLLAAPIQEIVDLFKWKDGKVEFDLFAEVGFFLADDLFGIVQSRQDEIRTLGYKVKKIENSGWGTIRRKFVVYDLESSKRNIWGSLSVIIVGVIFLMFWLFMYIVG